MFKSNSYLIGTILGLENCFAIYLLSGGEIRSYFQH